VQVYVSIEIDWPVADVWQFWAVEHVRNHPQWDRDIDGSGPVVTGER
jgi:hypothetical protein